MRIRTPRLELIPATLELVHADLHQRHRLPNLLKAEIAEGWPPVLLDVAAMQRIEQSLIADPITCGWTALYCLLRSPRRLIGIAGFKSKPRNGAVEIGYELLPQFHRRGFGTELIGAMVQWAFANGAELIFAETLPELIASQRVLVKNQFRFAGEGSEPGVLRFERRRA
jgi:[ribosomal protein S5]-alanine N-acetyltransferase